MHSMLPGWLCATRPLSLQPLLSRVEVFVEVYMKQYTVITATTDINSIDESDWCSTSKEAMYAFNVFEYESGTSVVIFEDGTLGFIAMRCIDDTHGV